MKNKNMTDTKRKMYIKVFNCETKDIDREKGIMRAVISSGQPDRGGDIVDQKSWKIDNYLRNPVVLWAHDHSRPSVAKTLDLFINEDGMLEAVFQFALEHSALARELFGLYADGFLNSFSVGFTNGRSEEKDGYRVLYDNELLEFSCVNVPMDALALAKSNGSVVDEIEKTMRENGELSEKSRELIQKAKDSLEALLEADSGKKTKKKVHKLQYNRIVNKAIRELIRAKNVKS